MALEQQFYLPFGPPETGIVLLPCYYTFSECNSADMEKGWKSLAWNVKNTPQLGYQNHCDCVYL